MTTLLKRRKKRNTPSLSTMNTPMKRITPPMATLMRKTMMTTRRRNMKRKRITPLTVTLMRKTMMTTRRRNMKRNMKRRSPPTRPQPTRPPPTRPPPTLPLKSTATAATEQPRPILCIRSVFELTA
jgi:hypothetical protein